MLGNLVMNISVALVVYVLGLISRRALGYFAGTLPTKRVWKLESDPKVHVVTANTPPETRIDQKEFAVTGYITEYMGAAHLSSALKRIYKQAVFYYDMECFFDYRNLRENLILIGGPVNNPATGRLFRELEIPYEFDGFSLVHKKTDRRFDAVITDYIEEDYALVVNCRNPFAGSGKSKKRCVLIAGCRTIGCYAGALYLAEHARQLKVGKHENYAFVVKIKGHSYSAIGDPELVEIEYF